MLSLVQLFQPFGVWNSRFTFQIGNEATLDRPWAGEVHVVALYSRALSADEITDNFLEASTAKTRSPEGLVSLYTFSERQGPVVYDRSGVEPPLNLIIAPEGHVRWHHSRNGIDIIKPAIIRSSSPATKLVTATKASNELSIEVWMTPVTPRKQALRASFRFLRTRGRGISRLARRVRRSNFASAHRSLAVMEYRSRSRAQTRYRRLRSLTWSPLIKKALKDCMSMESNRRRFSI